MVQTEPVINNLCLVLLSFVLVTVGGRSSTGESGEVPFKIVAGQPVPVRWETAARKLPLKYQPIPPDATRKSAIKLNSLKREGVSFQVSIGPGLDQPARVSEVSLPSLTHSSDQASIRGSSIELKEVGFIRNRKTGREWPDVLFPTGTLPGVSNGYSYTLWNTIYVPADVPPGAYSGMLTMTVEDRERTRTLRIPVKLTVGNYTLPNDVPVSTQLFSFNAESADLWYDFSGRNERMTYITEKVYPRYVRNRISPARLVPDPKPLYMRERPYGAGGPHGRFRNFDGSAGEQTEFSMDQTKEFTVSAWIRPDEGVSGNVLAQWGGGAKGMEWRVGSDEKLSIHLSTREEGRTIKTLNYGSLEPGEWAHVAVSVTNPDQPGSKVTVFLDGNRVDEAEVPGLKPSSRKLHLGSAYRTSIRPFSGGLDAVRVYPRVLSQKQIKRDQEGSDKLRSTASFSESFNEGIDINRVGEAYLKKWGTYWRTRGHYLNNLPIPRSWGKQRLKQFFDRMYPIIRSEGWGPYLYIRLPYDEATHGRKAKKNRAFARRMEEVAPDLLRHQTFGGGLRGKAIEKALEPHAGLVDIWSSVPGHYLKQYQGVKQWLYRRRKTHGEHLSWYIHRNIAVGNRYKDTYTVMDLRGFFWRMFQEDVYMCTLWSTTNWNRRTRKHRNRNLERVERGFELTPTTGMQTGNGLLFYPGESKNDQILDSMRVQIIRDSIEDVQYLTEVKQHASMKDGNGKNLLDRVKQIDERFVRFAPTVNLSPGELLSLRKRLADFLASTNN